MSYPGYTYQPYPKWVTAEDGRRIVVQDHRAHGRAIGRVVKEDGTVEEEGGQIELFLPSPDIQVAATPEIVPYIADPVVDEVTELPVEPPAEPVVAKPKRKSTTFFPKGD